MVQRFNLLQRMLVLAHALNRTINSEEFIGAIERLRRNVAHTEHNKSGLVMSKDLVNCVCNLLENAQKILEHSQLAFQQAKDSDPHDCPLQPISEEYLKKIDNVVISQSNYHRLRCRNNLLNNRVFIEKHPFEDVLTYEEISKDSEAKEALDALSIIVATLNLAFHIVDQINDVLFEIERCNVTTVINNELYLSFMLDILTITHSRFMMYKYLREHLKKTSKYFIRDKAIMLLCDENVKKTDLLELINCIPSQITIRYKSGESKVLFP